MLSFFLKPHYWIGGGGGIPGLPDPDGWLQEKKKKRKRCPKRKTYKIKKCKKKDLPEAVEVNAREFAEELIGERRKLILERIQESEKRKRKRKKASSMLLLRLLDDL